MAKPKHAHSKMTKEAWICPPICEAEHTLREVAEMLQCGWIDRRILTVHWHLYPCRIDKGMPYYRCQDIQDCCYDIEDNPLGIDYEKYAFMMGKRRSSPGLARRREKFAKIPKLKRKPMPHKIGMPGFVYLIKHNDLYKIGRAQDVERRIADIAIVPGEFSLIHSVKAEYSCSAETFLHRKYKHKRIHREWFALTEQDVADIQVFKDGDLDGDFILQQESMNANTPE
jgi:hypothetical protein